MFNSTSVRQGSVLDVGLAGAVLPDLRHWADGFLPPHKRGHPRKWDMWQIVNALASIRRTLKLATK